MRNPFSLMAGVLLLLALGCAPCLAGGHGANFNIYGKIVGIDQGARTIRVEVVTPESLIPDNPVTIQTTATTACKQCDEFDNTTRIDFADLQTGRMVRAMGEMDGAAFVATRVIQYLE